MAKSRSTKAPRSKGRAGAKPAKKAAKKASKKPGKKPAKKVSKKAAKKVSKKAARKATKKAAKKAARKAAKKVAKRASGARVAATRVAAIAPIKDGDRWEVFLEDGTSTTASAAAAQSIGLGVDSAWNAGIARRLAAAEDDQRAFSEAMQLLARGRRRWTRATLATTLGGDARARRAVAALAANGWIE
jgi:hypothetical protein